MSNYTTNATVNLSINGKQANQMLEQLKKQASQLEKAIAQASAQGNKATLTKLKKELRETNSMISQIESASKGVEKVMLRLDKATPKELQKTLSTLKKQLNGIERGTEEWEKQCNQIKRVRAELDKVNKELRQSEGFWDRFNRKMNDWQTTIAVGAAAVTGLVMAGRKAVNAYAEMDAEMANVRKFTGMTAEQVALLNEEFKKIDTRTSRQELNQLAQEAGRLGKSSQEDVLGFVRAADQINVALSDLGEGATLTLSKLTGIFGDEERLGTEQSLLAVGSVINELSQNCSASAPYLANFASRMGGVGAQAKMTIPQIMGFAAVLDSNNQKVEASATALSQVITRLYQDPAKYAKPAGLEVKAFAELLKKDANEAVITLLEQLNRLGNMDVLAPIFKDMGENGSRAISALSTLANNIETVKWQQQEATKAFNEATSVTKEFNVQNTTVQAELDKAKKRVAELAVELGEKLAPVMKHIISSTTLVMRVLSATIDFIVKYKGAIIVATASIVAYTIAVNAAAIKTKLLTLWQGIAKTAMVAWRAVTLLASATTALFTGNVTRATAAFKLFSATLRLSPIGLVATAITAVVGGLAMWAINAGKATEKQKALNEIEKEAQKSAAQELTNLRILYEQTQNQNIAMADRLKAVNKLQEQYPDYFKNLSKEAILAGNAKEAYDDLTQSILNTARAEGRRKKIATLEEEIIDLETEYKKEYDRLYNTLMMNGIIYDTGELGSGGAGAYAPEYLTFKRLKAIYADPVSEKRQLQEELTEDVVIIETNNQSSNNNGGGGDDDDDFTPTPTPTTTTDKFQAENDWRTKEDALNRIAYARGEKSYTEYTNRMHEIEVEFYQKQLAHTDLSVTELYSIQAQYYEAVKKQSDTLNAQTIDTEIQAYNERLAEAKQFFIDGKYSIETYNEAVQRIEEEHLQNLVNLTKEGTQERIDAEKALAEFQYQAALKKQQEERKRQADIKKSQDDLKKTYFGDNINERTNAYNSDLANLAIVYQAELKATEGNEAEKLRITEAYEQAKLALRRKYGLISADENLNALEKVNADLAEWLESDAGKAVMQSFDVVMSGMGAIFSQVSSLVQAELEIQTAAIEKRYDKEISLAEGNTYKVKKLEEKKQADIAKAKNEANRKMFAMQVIQAVAQTATNAISAYGSAAAIPVVGFIMAPIAAAMAIAAGALQIAAIKKQQQASEAQGYSKGGFTPKGGVNEEVGVVHAGEWVASQRLLANPQARAMIETLDYAQRTNTIGSLSATDVSRSITAPINGATPQVVVQTIPDNTQLLESLALLNQRLNEPFVTVNTITGDTGIKKAQDEYNKLIKNKTPKSKR